MKAMISVLILLVVVLTVWKLWEYWDRVETNKDRAEREAKKQVDPHSLAGLEWKFEDSLQKAMDQKDPAALKAWLDKHSRIVQDPRLAWIELDYVMLIAPQNPLEAKKVYHAVKERTPPESPVYKRVKSLEKTYD
jgi:hypothetical protein